MLWTISWVGPVAWQPSVCGFSSCWTEPDYLFHLFFFFFLVFILNYANQAASSCLLDSQKGNVCINVKLFHYDLLVSRNLMEKKLHIDLNSLLKLFMFGISFRGGPFLWRYSLRTKPAICIFEFFFFHLW